MQYREEMGDFESDNTSRMNTSSAALIRAEVT